MACVGLCVGVCKCVCVSVGNICRYVQCVLV